MPVQFINAGFSASDGVPGAYGEVVYGAGSSSAAAIPLKLLCVGIMNSVSGTATPDVTVQPIYSQNDADNYFGAGGQLNIMLRAALRIPGVQVFGAAPAAAGGAVAASCTLTFVAGQTIAGTYNFRVAGFALNLTVGATDTATVVATNFKNLVNSYPGLPVKVTNVAGVCTLTAKSLGTSGNTILYWQDTTQLPSGCTATITGAGTAVTNGAVPLSGGTGTENVTNLLAVINPQHYDRIAIATTDATNAGLWRTQIDAQAGIVTGNLQHVVSAVSGTLSAAETYAQTNINDQRFQCMWYLNSETTTPELAAIFASARTSFEQTDPDQSYDGYILPGVYGQDKGDWPNHATLVGAINNSITAITGTPDGRASVVRSITTRSLNGTTPDYSTRDTGQAVVPDFILTDLKLYWSSTFVKSNPRVADDGPVGSKPPAAGVATPSSWVSLVTKKMRDYERGVIGATTIAPIIINVDNNLPFASFNAASNMIMLAAPIQVAPAHHQIGISVRQS